MRTFLRTGVLLAALSLGLGGCFRPLYGSQEYGGLGVQKGLQGISIEIRGERLAHYIRNELEFGLRGGDPTNAPQTHRLVITTSQTVATAIVERLTGAAESATLTIEGKYTLYPIESATIANAGTATVVVSYDRSAQRFASIRSGRDAEIQAARQLAEQIKTRVAAYLASSR